jgi:hypothetical protein
VIFVLAGVHAATRFVAAFGRASGRVRSAAQLAVLKRRRLGNRCCIPVLESKKWSEDWSTRHGPKCRRAIEIANHPVIIGDCAGVPDGI